MVSEGSEPGRVSLSPVAGCLLGGALGEALGRRLAGLAPGAAAGQLLVPGWQTQRMMVTAEGLLRADNRLRARGFADLAGVLLNAYRRWLAVQGHDMPGLSEPLARAESWLLRLPALTERRGVSETLVAAIRPGVVGRPGQPLNDSRGSEALTHIAPVGLLRPEVDVALVAMEVAALTHGHIIAQFAAGFVAIVIHRLLGDRTLEAALHDALAWLAWARRERQDGATLAPLVETLRDILRAPTDALAAAARAGAFGAGQSADEALAIAVAGVRAARDFEHGVSLAVSHGGARDTTGTLAGQLLGVAWAASGLPERWLAALDLRGTLLELSDDWERHFLRGGARDHEKYPGF